MFRDGDVKSQLSVIHQTGQNDYDMVKKHSMSLPGLSRGHAVSLRYANRPFVRRISSCRRSGAMTMAELTVCGKPAVLIPFPQSIYQHQLHTMPRCWKKPGAALDDSAKRTGRRKIGGGRWGLVSKPASTGSRWASGAARWVERIRPATIVRELFHNSYKERRGARGSTGGKGTRVPFGL